MSEERKGGNVEKMKEEKRREGEKGQQEDKKSCGSEKEE